MSDSSVKNLAITDKVQKPGGCAGIFFQLIDWKKRLVKKKLFSKKLLTPARAKKFRGDEKMPNSKHHLIANENSGGFPKDGSYGVDVDQKREMRVPSLVARLMGLDSIPASQRDKSKKALCPDYSCGDEKGCLGNDCELDRQGNDLEMRVVKHDSRPQKLQKTGVCERKAVTRFGAEALHIRSVLSRAKKYNHNNHHHHPKLASPLKSPRISSGKSASRSSRLIGAAAKILEPGLQGSRGKGTLMYHASACPLKTSIVMDDAGNKSSVMQNQSCHVSSTSKPLIGQTSCKNCGNLLDVIDCKAEVRGPPDVPPPLVSDAITATSMASSYKGKSFTPSHGQERDIVLLRSQEKFSSHAADEEGKNYSQQSWNEPTTIRMSRPREGPAKWSSSCQPLRTREDDASSFTYKHKTQEPNLSSESSSSGSTTCSMQVKRVSSCASSARGTKDFVALNRSASGKTRMRSPTKVDSSKFDLEKKPCNRQHESLSHVRSLERKRTPNVTPLKGTTPANSVGLKQRNLRHDAISGKRRDFDSSSLIVSNVKNRDGRGEPVKVSHNRNNDAVSFTFSAPLKQKMGMLTEEEKINYNNERNKYFERPSPLKVDGLGAFLEEKLKELTSQQNDVPQKSSAVILQELISALSSEHLICHDGHMHNEDAGFLCGAKQENLLGTSCSGNHLSPGSVLEASFSSSSLDESSGRGFHPDSMNFSYSQPEQSEHDDELLDSAASFNKGSISKILAVIINQIPMALQCLYSFGTQFTRSNFNNMKDVLLNAELVLQISNERSEEEIPQLLIHRFLLNELDTMTDDAMWTDFNSFVGYDDSKSRTMLKGFVSDCVVEYLESNCCQYFTSGFNAWTKLPLCIKAENLVEEVKREVKKCACMTEMVPDEIIEWEMSHSLGKWDDFDIEAFEAGVDIDGYILHNLVDEVVVDLVGCKHSSYSF
ncbi:uncharacterized protein LOC123888768 [Trifolium pratense]|uniref:uncharacterized protein LOC123888768 n=1 Tax=Trifolium pratense TaxID=57577 RepID=UPI001E6945D5|nr:uncharacterized protein LOC123888768 [Trifolium pratense]